MVDISKQAISREQALEEAETQGNLKQWNIQDHLKTPGSIAEYLQATLDEGDSELLINAVSDVIRALKSQPATEFGGKELVNSFNRGYVIACANIVNMYGAKVEVAEGFAQLSITKGDFEALELCSYDKDAIKTLEEFAGEEKLFVSSDHTPQTGGRDEV